ncbi:hypothetical protein ACIOHS_45300 [Streptomyces sp. NPDC088253]|uniref:hypothetical protein n=1 Tax=Streptomyces sp. NPDC088253 TaxID=3365846 RepID=UPI0038148348
MTGAWRDELGSTGAASGRGREGAPRTGELAVDATSGAITQRRGDPCGAPRGKLTPENGKRPGETGPRTRATPPSRPVPASDGWQERVREKPAASERAFLVAEKGHEEIRFRWRPGRGNQSVWGSMSFDAPSGDVVLDVRDGEGLLGVAGLGKGASFAAVCQIAGVAGLASGTARG